MTACCGVFVSFASILIYTFGVFLKPLASTFGWSRAQVSLAFTVTALTVAACSPFIGRLLDRYPARRIVIPCTAVYGLAFGSLAFLTPHISHLLLVFLILGIVGNGTTQLGYARIISAWFDQSRGRALAAVMAGSGAGSMIFPPLAQALITSYGWRIAYAALGGLILVLGLPLAVLI
ncbi:MAG: MFS transporter, partial [Acidobacteriota bacterium]|nr:MFS transporter [Acidobacteriota bacterium]